MQVILRNLTPEQRELLGLDRATSHKDVSVIIPQQFVATFFAIIKGLPMEEVLLITPATHEVTPFVAVNGC